MNHQDWQQEPTREKMSRSDAAKEVGARLAQSEVQDAMSRAPVTVVPRTVVPPVVTPSLAERQTQRGRELQTQRGRELASPGPPIMTNSWKDYLC